MPSPQLTVSEASSEALIHDRHVILGRELQPFCIDHWLILKELKSPMIYGGAVTITDMQLAVKACFTRTTQEFYDACLRPKPSWILWDIVTKGRPTGPLVAQWNEYVEDFAPCFPQWRYADQEESKCPGIIVTAAKLVKAGHKPADVRRMAIGEVTLWAIAIAESDGHELKGIKTDDEVMTIREIEAEGTKNV